MNRPMVKGISFLVQDQDGREIVCDNRFEEISKRLEGYTCSKDTTREHSQALGTRHEKEEALRLSPEKAPGEGTRIHQPWIYRKN